MVSVFQLLRPSIFSKKSAFKSFQSISLGGFGVEYSAESESRIPLSTEQNSSEIESMQMAMTGKGIAAATLNTTAFADAITPFLNRADNPGYPAPWAYINWIFLDEQFNYAGGGSDRIGKSGEVKTHDNTTIPTINVPKNGYVFIYCSNESNYPVFFDNLQVIHTAGPVLEETHYYPFGLTMAGISSKAMGKMNNKFKFNGGNELQNGEFGDGTGLEWYDAVHRMYDPQTGRFNQIDEMADGFWEWSPFSFGLNSPIRRNDPLGLEPETERKRKYDKRTDGNTQEVLDAAVVVGRRSRESLVKHYWYYRNNNLSFKEAPKDMRNWLYRYDRTEKFLERVREINRERDIITLDIASNFLPTGWLTKLRYLKYARYLASSKRGAVKIARGAAKIAETYSGEPAKNLAKERIANRGDWSEVDIFDILTSTAASKVNLVGKAGVEVLNATTDVKAAGAVSVFSPDDNYRKGIDAFGLDVIFGYVKFKTNVIAESRGTSELSKDILDVFFDQGKTSVSNAKK